MLIAIEGIDGSGKTTQIELLAKALSDLNHSVVTSKEPTDGKYGTLLRDSAFSGRRNPQEELDLFIKDRKEHVTTLIAPGLKAGKIVILDRYYFSTIAYQSVRGLDPLHIRHQNESFAPKPDLLFVLEVSIEESLRRIGVRDGQGNDFEGRENLEQCRAIFKKMTGDFIFHINAERSPEQIHQEIMKIVSSKLAG